MQVGKGIIAYIEHYDNVTKTGYNFSLDKFENKKLVSHMTSSMIQYDTISDSKISLDNQQLHDKNSQRECVNTLQKRVKNRFYDRDGAYRPCIF